MKPSYCTITSKAGVSIFLLIMGIPFLVIAIVVIAVNRDISALSDFAGMLIISLMSAFFGIMSLYHGWNGLMESRYKICYITANGMYFLGKNGLKRDFPKDDIRKMHFQGKGRVKGNVHDFIIFYTYGNTGKKKRYDIAPKFNANEMMRSLTEISEPYWERKGK